MTREPFVTQTALRMALVCWFIDPDHGMTPSQYAWLTIRLAAQTPLTPGERAPLAAVVARQYEDARRASWAALK